MYFISKRGKVMTKGARRTKYLKGKGRILHRVDFIPRKIRLFLNNILDSWFFLGMESGRDVKF